MSLSTSFDQLRSEAWLGLTLEPGWGPVRIWHAVGIPPDPVKIWQRVKNAQSIVRLKEQIAACNTKSITVITWDHPAYPVSLRNMKYPPPVLFSRGSLQLGDEAAVAIVGSRRCSPHASQLSFMLARDLAAAGITIVSGLAIGVDAAAHRGALAAGGRTIAVMGCGADRVYPLSHVNLAVEVAASGCLISQFPCGVTAARGHFPARNRVMAGLVLGVVVVEASDKSGALITAGDALEIGREVMVCPGDVLREHTRGSNGLLRDGARAVLDGSDVISELKEPLWRILDTLPKPQGEKLRPVPVGQMAHLPLDTTDESINTPPHVHTQLWETLFKKAYSTDQLAEASKLDCDYVRRALTELEMLGFVQRDPYGRYQQVEKMKKSKQTHNDGGKV